MSQKWERFFPLWHFKKIFKIKRTSSKVRQQARLDCSCSEKAGVEQLKVISYRYRNYTPPPSFASKNNSDLAITLVPLYRTMKR